MSTFTLVSAKSATFKSGKNGFRISEKAISTDGMFTLDDAPLIAVAATFSTGSTGFRLLGKIVHGGKRYQVTGQAVLIGSKAGAVKTAGYYQAQLYVSPITEK